MAEQLPSVDDLLGAPPEQGAPKTFHGLPLASTMQAPPNAATATVAGHRSPLPSVDDLLGQAGVPGAPSFNPPTGPSWDAYVKATPMGRVLDAFGQGAAEGWGTGNLGLSDETSEALKKAGIFPDVEKSQGGVVRALNEAIIRPLASGIDLLNRGMSAGFRAVQSGVAAAGNEIPAAPIETATQGGVGGYLRESAASLLNPQQAGQAAAAVPEAFFGMPGGLGVPAAEVPRLPEAADMRVIGAGEGAYFGTVEPRGMPESVTADAVKEMQDAAANTNRPGEVPSSYAEGALGPAPTEAPIAPYEATPAPSVDIHEAARRADPGTFAEYDDLTQRRDALRDQISVAQADLRQRVEAQAPHQEEIADLQERLQDTTPRLAKKYEARLETLVPERDAFLADDFTMGALTRDTPDIAAMRQELQRVDYRMRDLAPNVTAAYRQVAPEFPEQPAAAPAQEASPAAAAPPAEAPRAAQPATEPPPLTPVSTQPVEAPAPPALSAEPAREAPNVATDVAQKLVSAGRPQAEADAAGQIIAAHYDARAARFGGAKGTGADLYQAEGPDIRGSEVGGRKGVAAGKAFIKDGRTVITLFRRADASTFIHETGHQWLEELMADGRDEGAPADLREDVGAVRNWLGADRDSGITTKQHEKFARGFERYMMEGVAPTRALDRVFAQFRDWLTRIYQAIRRAGEPINDDIRDVFDRMLTTEPEPATIAPEPPARPLEEEVGAHPAVPEAQATPASTTPPAIRTIQEIMAQERTTAGRAKRIQEGEIEARAAWRPPSAPPIETSAKVATDLADLHEADAAETAPAQAAQVADEVRAETDSTIRTHAPEIADEFLGQRPNSETSGGPEQGAAPSGAGSATEPASEAEAVPRPGQISGGGGQAAPEGTGGTEGAVAERPRPRGQPERATAAAERATWPDESFPEPAGDLIDKAGNIRLENLTGDEDIRKVFREAAASNDEFWAARRGVVSDQDVADMAGAMGIDAREINLQKLRAMSLEDEVPLAVRVRVGREMALQSANAVHVAMGGTDQAAYILARNRHLMIQETVSGITAEWGRAGRAFRDFSEDLKETKDLASFLRENEGRTLFQIQQEMRQGTQLETARQIGKYVIDAQKTGLFDWVQSVFINALLSGPFTHMGYTVAGEIYGLFRASAETGAAAAVGVAREALGVGGAERAHFGEMGHQLYGMFRGAVNGSKAAWSAFKANAPQLPPEAMALVRAKGEGRAMGAREIIPNPEIGGVRVPIGTVLESPSRLVTALHTFNWTTFYSQSISSQAFRTAISEGLEGQTLADRIATLTTSPTEAMIREASTDASNGALMTRPSYDSFMGSISRLTNWGVQVPDIPLPGDLSIPMGTIRPLKYIDPFVQIAANVQRAAFGRGTPLALFHQAVRDDLAMKNGGAAFDRTAGRIIAGTGFMIAAGGLAAKGLLNPSGPSERDQSRAWQRVYGMPHGLNIGATSFDMLRLGALGMQMSVAADLYSVAQSLGKEDASKVAAEVVHAFAQNILDESFMRGPAEIMQVAEDTNRYGGAWVRNFVSSAVPFSVGMSQVARQIDPYSRQARTTMDAIISKIPGASETLVPRYDVWGQPVPNRGWAATSHQAISQDPVDGALYQLGVYPSLPERRIRSVPLTDGQYEEFSKTSGRIAWMRISSLVGQPGFSALPHGVQVQTIRETLENARETARTVVLMKYPDIIQKALETKRAQLSGDAGK